MEYFEKFYNSALRFLSYRPRSEKEVRDKLKILTKRHSGLSRIDSGVAVSEAERAPQNDIIEKIIVKLKEKKFINDEEFARMFVENRLRFKPRSLRLIKLELKNKGIDDEIIERLVADRGSQTVGDLEQAKKLVEKKMGRFRNKFGMTREEIYQKLGRFLASKGFNWDTIKKSIDYVYETKRS
ncbi:MAG: regulatory protein RecX [Candidatus Levybacteria bacterium]|nr:regulatory protein RecX [Candidatus Levybacteria bacterium]